MRVLYCGERTLVRVVVLAGMLCAFGSICFGQQPDRGFGGPPPPGVGINAGPGWPGAPGPGVPGLLGGPPGRWWDDAALARKLALTADQQKKMDDIFNTNRLKLIDLFASVQKEEAILEPLVDADPPDENKVLAQVDRLGQTRAELERTVARMLLDLRLQLTHDQWVKLKAERPSISDMRGAPRGGPFPGMPGGPSGTPHP